jgi:hypothetical protein
MVQCWASAAGILFAGITPKKFLYLSPVDSSAGDLFFYLNAVPYSKPYTLKDAKRCNMLMGLK